MLNSIQDIGNNDLLWTIIQLLDGVVITDKEGRYVFVNDNWSHLMGGMTLDEVRGLYVHDVVPETRVDEALKTGKILTGYDLVMNTRNGTMRLFCTYVPIYERGEIAGCFIYVVFRGMDEAIDFATKVSELLHKVEYYQRELKELRGARYGIGNIIGESEGIQRVKREIFKAARSASTVLITGETGVGKELVAHAIHDLSARMDAPFIKVNCSAIPSELLESEFFGYESGAFTGARKGGKAGKFELAHRGSLFLDEINQMPLSLQPKLLRVLQEREIEPLGGKGSIPVDVRIIAASNVNLEASVRHKAFRTDLFYRLNVLTIQIPPLRERRSDIPLLAEHLVKKLNFEMGLDVSGISEEAKTHLMAYHWPGNIRELQNVIERGMNTVWNDVLEWRHIKDYFERRDRHFDISEKGTFAVQDPDVDICGDGGRTGWTPDIRLGKEAFERQCIQAALTRCNGNKTQAARQLGITRAMLYRKLNKYDLR